MNEFEMIPTKSRGMFTCKSMGIPLVMVDELCQFLPTEDLVSLGFTSPLFYQQCLKSAYLWRTFTLPTNIRGNESPAVVENFLMTVINTIGIYVETLNIKGSKVSADVLIDISSKFPNLVNLDFSKTKEVNDDVISSFTSNCPRLESVHVNVCPNITDEALTLIGNNCSGIRDISANGCRQLSTTGVKNMVDNQSFQLESVSFSGCPKVNNDALIALAYNSHSLKSIKVRGCGRILSSGIIAIAENLPQLERLDISTSNPMVASMSFVDDISLAHLASKCVKLKQLSIAGHAKISYKMLDILRKFNPSITHLDIGGCRGLLQSPKFLLKILSNFVEIESLGLWLGKFITDEFVADILPACKKLKYIDLDGCKTTIKSQKLLGRV